MSKRSISDVLTANPAVTNSKRSKTDESSLLLNLEEASILALPQIELADAFIKLRTAYQDQKASIQALQKANTAAVKAIPVDVVTWSPEKIKEKAEHAASLALKGINSQMKWTQSCRNGRARFSYGSILPNEQVFRAVVALPATKKTPKLYKMPKKEFFKSVGEPYKSIRYDELCVTGDHVNVRWNAEDCEFTISGTYGLERVEAAKEARAGGDDE